MCVRRTELAREEPGVIAALAELCRQYGIKTLVQVGAEDGYEAEMIRLEIGCRAIAIDADPRGAPCSSALEFHEALIGATDSAAVDFYVHQAKGLSSVYLRPEESGQEIHVMPQHRLDTFCAQHGIAPDALIIDTEGSALNVLEGCGDLLNGIKILYVEVQNSLDRPGMRHASEVERFLAERGFVMRPGAPSYNAGAQSNKTWVKG